MIGNGRNFQTQETRLLKSADMWSRNRLANIIQFFKFEIFLLLLSKASKSPELSLSIHTPVTYPRQFRIDSFSSLCIDFPCLSQKTGLLNEIKIES